MEKKNRSVGWVTDVREAIARLDYETRRRARQVALQLRLAEIRAAEDEIEGKMLELKNQKSKMTFMKPRYDYPEDRFDLRRWLQSPGPTRDPYWRHNLERDSLTLEIGNGYSFLAYDIPVRALIVSDNWRADVARALRLLRREFRSRFGTGRASKKHLESLSTYDWLRYGASMKSTRKVE